MSYPDLSNPMIEFMLKLPCPTTTSVHGSTLEALLAPGFTAYTGPRGLVYVDTSPRDGRVYRPTLLGLGWLQGYDERRRAEMPALATEPVK